MGKIVEEHITDEYEIWTDSGWQDFGGVAKTVEYEIWTIETEHGHILQAADEHLVFDELGRTIFVDSLKIGDKIVTDCGLSEVVRVEKSDEKEEMFDAINVRNGSRFFSNGILSHNTTTTAAYICHYILFNKFKRVAILGDKSATAREILQRVQLMYENLPYWMQQGISEWNKGSILLENGTSIITGATSSSSIRGKSVNFLYLDEFAFIMPGVFDEFFASVYPTVASSKKSKIVMSSTPWGMNHFYKIWMDAENGKNGYTHFSVKWNDIPGRDEEYKEKTIAEVGLLKWLQEYEACVGPNTLIFIRDKETGEIKETEIYKMNIINAYFGCDRFEVLTPKGWSDFSGIRTVKKPEYLKIFFSDKSDIVVSLDHRFIHRGEEIFAFDLKEGDFLESRFNEKQICKIEYHNEEIEVYDLLNVAKDQHYYTEDVISHNCFLGSSNTLIDSNTLRDMVFVDPVDLSFEESFRVYAKPEEKHKYVLFCDVAEGLGGDSEG